MHTVPEAYEQTEGKMEVKEVYCDKCKKNVYASYGIWHCLSKDITCQTDICINCKTEDSSNIYERKPDENLTVLKEFITLLAPNGQLFFNQYVHKRFQFMDNIDNFRLLNDTESVLLDALNRPKD